MNSLDAIAKLNLYLKVTGKRADGYHELLTLFFPVNALADTLTLEQGEPGIRLNTDGLGDLGAGNDNLVVRAARSYAEAAEIAPAWRFRLTKRIPVAAGMGGGSSDAAAALRLLNQQYGLLTAAELAAIALKLGADVPYFLAPATGFATGIGERFTALDGAALKLPLLIVNPRFPVSAKWAYSNLDPARIGPDCENRAEALAAALRANDPAAIAANLHNDLAPALYRKFPLLDMLRCFLCQNGALNAEITGSGSTMYAIAPDCGALGELARRTRDHFGETLLLFEG
ncbi:MAG: 4-(cytidine 5'-diphospho)-2-C-methyl-D-erythritol kinase [Victivallaceae bacterium]